MTVGDLETIPWLVRYTVRRTQYANAASSEWDPLRGLIAYGQTRIRGQAYKPDRDGWDDLTHAVEKPVETIWERAPYWRDDHAAEFSRGSNVPVRRTAGKRTIVVSPRGLRALHDIQAECLLNWQSVQNELLARECKTWVKETRLKLSRVIEHPNPVELIASLDHGHRSVDLFIDLRNR